VYQVLGVTVSTALPSCTMLPFTSLRSVMVLALRSVTYT